MTGETRSNDTDVSLNLARVADFDIGPLRVRPSRRQIVAHDGVVRDLEPRVMKVLVALASAERNVVSRDELVERCWDGRIVGDDAINRCIGALRNLGRSLDPQPFSIETFPRIGYSLTANDTPSNDLPLSANLTDKRRRPDRRKILGGIGAVGLLAVGGAFYWSGRDAAAGSNNEAALEWYRRGIEAREQGLAELFPQVQAFFRQAVEADPDFADAWSALALSYASPVFLEGGNEQAALAQRARAAAERALRLDPGSVEARTALAFIPSEFGRWADSQSELRALIEAAADRPYLYWVLHSRLTHSLSECGRCKDALAMARSTAGLNPLHPGSAVNLVTTAWLAGELEEANRESERALVRWPSHTGLWLTRLAFLTFSGRATDAVAMGTASNRPPSVERYGVLDRRLAAARALADQKTVDIDRAVQLYEEHMALYPDEMMPATRLYAALGRLDPVFEVMDAYFFNSGRRALANRPPIDALTRLDATSLFWPPMAPAWRDTRFAQLAERIGLERYWEATGSAPDFRRL